MAVPPRRPGRRDLGGALRRGQGLGRRRRGLRGHPLRARAGHDAGRARVTSRVERTRILEVIAVEPIHVIRLDRRDLGAVHGRHPSVKDRVLEALASNSRWQTTMISSAARRPLTDRLILRLLELAESSPRARLGRGGHAEDLAVDARGDDRRQPGEREPGAGGAGDPTARSARRTGATSSSTRSGCAARCRGTGRWPVAATDAGSVRR